MISLLYQCFLILHNLTIRVTWIVIPVIWRLTVDYWRNARLIMSLPLLLRKCILRQILVIVFGFIITIGFLKIIEFLFFDKNGIQFLWRFFSLPRFFSTF